MDTSSNGAPGNGPAAGAAAAVVLRQSRLQRDGLFGALVAVFPWCPRTRLPARADHHRQVVSLGGSRYRRPGLAIAGSGTAIPLPFFSAREVRRQCLAAGWSFASRR